MYEAFESDHDVILYFLHVYRDCIIIPELNFNGITGGSDFGHCYRLEIIEDTRER